MKAIKTTLFLMLCCCFFVINADAQSVDNDFNTSYNKDVIPPSPSAATLNKGADITANLATGAPSVNIPLYNVESRHLSLPISLNYASNGVKVNDMASPEGLSWSLNCGGSINRTVLGVPDEKRTANSNTFTNFNVDFFNWTYDNFDYAINNDSYDKQSDIFIINVADINCKFILDSNFTPQPLNATLISIQKIDADILDGFIVRNAEGVIYRFDVPESSTQTISGFQGPHYQAPVITSWYLSEIIKPGQDTIHLSYVDNSYAYCSEVDEGLDILMTIAPVENTSCTPQASNPYTYKHNVYQTTSTISGKLLSEIVCVQGKVKFNYLSGRLDDGGNKLSDIEVLNNNEDIIKKVSFMTDYFKATDTTLPTRYIYKPSFKYRLYLKELKIEGWNGVQADSTYRYSFEYFNGNQLPCRLSANQDYFGYYNGRSNSTLLPDVRSDYPTIYSKIGKSIYGDRSPDTVKMMYGQLSKIVYPTGGYETLVYDYNKKIENKIVLNSAPFNFNCITTSSQSSAQNQTTLTIPFSQNLNSIYFQLFATGTATVDPIHDQATITISNNSTGATLWTATLTSVGSSTTKTLNSLPAADYLVKIKVSGRGMEGNVNFDYQPSLPDTVAEAKPLGGLNIHKIKSYNRNGETLSQKRYEYVYKSNNKISTFEISGLHQMWTNSIVPQMFTCDPGSGYVNICAHEANYTYLNVSSSILTPINLIGSSPTYNYSVLEFVDKSDSSLLTEHDFKYHGALGANQVIGDKILGTPYSVYNDLLMGENITNLYVQTSGSDYQLVHSSETEFSADDPISLVFNYNVRKKCAPICRFAVPQSDHELLCLDVERYPIVFTRDISLKTNSTDYSLSNNEEIQKTSSYTYGNVKYPVVTEKKEDKSNGDTVVTSYKYPFDFTGTIYDSMIARNILPLIETKISINGVQLERSFKQFTFFNNKQLLIPSVFQLQHKNLPIENVFRINSVDQYGNILSQQKSHDVTQEFVWGYNGVFPVAKIIGGNYSLIKSQIDSIKLYNASSYSDDVIRTELNKIRTLLNSTGAQVYTYTYKPLFGMSSSTDPTGTTTYYDYDAMGRLQMIKDQSKRIKQKFDYHYYK